ncbi:GP46-like surface antigen, putative, partial [Bodo saltans]
MTQLATFSVSNNSLNGTFPPSLKFTAATMVSFGYNNLSIPIPPCATTWPKLTVLDVQNSTHLSGSMTLPAGMFAATVCGTQLCLGADVLSYQVTSCMPAGLLYCAAQTKSVPLLLKAANDDAYSLTECSATTTAAPPLPTAAPPQQQFVVHQQPII